MIKVSELTKRYARTTAVDHISFEVEKGQIVGFLGPNGAGKTTTMRMLTCFLPPTSGAASVAGFDVLEQPMEVKKRIGYLPEMPPLYHEMRATEYLMFVGKLKGLAGTDLRQRVDTACERCAITDMKDKLLGKLSKGYRQRVGLAQAILHNPDVLILDEPTAGLDPKLIIETRELIKGLGGEHTIVLSTHILPEVSMTCGRVVIINKGRVVAEDTPENLTHRLQGAATVRLEVKGDGPEMESALGAIAGVKTVRHPRPGVFEIDAEAGRDVRADLARLVVAKGLDLLALAQAGMSLEEIFLHLTTTDVAAEPPAATEAPPPAASGEVQA